MLRLVYLALVASTVSSYACTTDMFVAHALHGAASSRHAPALMAASTFRREMRKVRVIAIREERRRKAQLRRDLANALTESKAMKDHLKALTTEAASRRGGMMMRARLVASKKEQELLQRAAQLQSQLEQTTTMLSELEAEAALVV